MIYFLKTLLEVILDLSIQLGLDIARLLKKFS